MYSVTASRVLVSILRHLCNDGFIDCMLRQGTIIIKRKQMKTVKYQANGTPVERQVVVPVMLHEDLIGNRFWEDNSDLFT